MPTFATSGGALYRKATFLVDSLGQPIFPKHINVQEDPHILKGKGSAPFDDEGVLTLQTPRREERRGARLLPVELFGTQLGMRTTGHAGGSQNLVLTSKLTNPKDNLKAMLPQAGRGLFVTELMGQGVNYVTGDYSRVAQQATGWKKAKLPSRFTKSPSLVTWARCSANRCGRGRRLHLRQQNNRLGAD